MTWHGSTSLRQMMVTPVKDGNWLTRLYTTLLRSAAEWEKHDLGWREVVLAIGSLQHLLYDDNTKLAMLSMWCMTLTAKAADGDDLRTIVQKLFIDNHQFDWSLNCFPIKDNTIQSTSTSPIPNAGSSFNQIKTILQETENRVSADEALLLLKVLAGNGGVQHIISDGCEPILIQASAPLKPVAVSSSSGEQSPVWDESVLLNTNTEEGSLVIWSDGKVSSLSYVSKCWRGLGLDSCCHIFKYLTNDSDIKEISKDWGNQLALDSTSEYTMGVLEKVSHLSCSYQITTNLLSAIVHRARTIHKYSVLTHLVVEHPEYFARKWFLEAVLSSVDRDKNLKTVQHIILELHRTIVECIEPCFKAELEKTLSVFMGWSLPNRSSDSSSPNSELLAEVSSCSRTVIQLLPISKFRSEPYSLSVLRHILLCSVFREVDPEEAESLADQWSVALGEVEFQFFSKEVLETAGQANSTYVSELVVGMVPTNGDAVTGLIRVLSSLPTQHSVSDKVHPSENPIAALVLKIWESSFHPHPLGAWSDLAGPVNLMQVSPHTKYEYTLAWHSVPRSGDTSVIKNKCLTPTFVRRLLYLTTVLNGFRTATLTGPSTYKDSLVETYCKLGSLNRIVCNAIDVFQLTEWLRSEHTEANKYSQHNFERCVVHLRGVVPDASLTQLAKSQNVELIYTISEKQLNNLTDGVIDMVVCDPLPVDEVAMITSWMLRVNGQANTPPAVTAATDKIVSLLSSYYTASQRTTSPLTLSDISEITVRLVDDNASSEDLDSVLVFELVSRQSSLSVSDRAVLRHAIRSTKTEIALKFEEASKDEDPDIEADIQIHIQRESQSRVTSFVKDKFRAGKSKFKSIFGGSNNDQPSPSKSPSK